MRTMAALLERDCHLEVVVSDYGRRLLHDELGEAASVSRLREYLVEKYGEPASRGTLHRPQQQGSRRDDRERQPRLRGDGDRARAR